MSIKIKDLSIKELGEHYRNGTLSPVEVTKSLLEDINADKDINAFITITDEVALRAAKESEKRFEEGKPLSLMDGIPYSAKDNFYTKGILTTIASEIYKDFYPDYSASVVDRLAAAGAILMGKNNTHEFASGPTTDVTFFGPTRNPRNLDHVPGGSSGGSSAAIAARMVPASIGTDTTGSLRLPAACCGVVGMKPTYGRVSKYGVYPLSTSVDHTGPFTRTIEDSAIMLNIMAGYDAKDPVSLNVPVPDFTKEIGESVKDLVIGVPLCIFEDTTEYVIYEDVMKTIEILRDMGAIIKIMDDPDPTKKYAEACKVVRICEGYELHRKNLEEKAHMYSPEIYNAMLVGRGYQAYEYIEAMRLKVEYKEKFKEIMKDIDVMITPSMPLLPSKVNQREVFIRGVKHSIFARYNLFTLIASFTGCPAISMPCGFNADNLPSNIQIIAKDYEESKIFRVAYQIEQALNLDV